MAARPRRHVSRIAEQPRGDFCDGTKKAINEPSFATSMEWDTQVVKGSSSVGPAGLGLEELPFRPRLPRWLQPERCAVFQCAQCHAVLADSVHLAWDLSRSLGAVVFSSEWARRLLTGWLRAAGRKAGWKFGRNLTPLPGVGGRITFYDIRDHDEPFWLREVFPFSAPQVVILTCVCLLGVTNNVVLEPQFQVGVEGSLKGRYVLKIPELSLVIPWLIVVEERGTDLDQKFFPIFHWEKCLFRSYSVLEECSVYLIVLY